MTVVTGVDKFIYFGKIQGEKLIVKSTEKYNTLPIKLNLKKKCYKADRFRNNF
jgi:hypothetical protein